MNSSAEKGVSCGPKQSSSIGGPQILSKVLKGGF